MSSNPNWQAESAQSSQYGGLGQQQSHSQSTQNVSQFQEIVRGFSQEDMIAIRECNQQAFYNRCLPFSALFTGLTYYAMKSGYLQKSKSGAYWPKITSAILVGYILGKISYQKKCEEKFLMLPNSNLANAIRKRKGLSTNEEITSPINPDYNPGLVSPDTFSRGPSGEVERRDFSDHDSGTDSFDSVTENLSPYSKIEEDVMFTPSLSYDELRTANREEYMNKVSEKYKKQHEPGRFATPPSSFQGSSSAYDSSRFSQPHQHPESSYNQPSVSRPNSSKKNKYGDDWE